MSSASADIVVTALAKEALNVAMQGARRYYDTHKSAPVSEDALAECVRSWVKAKTPEAVRDAREAVECNMTHAAAWTFSATMLQAGIEAAKEASK